MPENNPSNPPSPDEPPAENRNDDATLAPGQMDPAAEREAETLGRASESTADATSPVVGREFGDYRLVEEIARGGMGVVYRAHQKSLNRDVAIKMILAGEFASPDDVDRFYTEAKAAANLDHPAIVPVYDFGQIQSHHFFSMKLIEGGHLGQRLPELKNDLRQAMEIMIRVCEGVHHAHQRGILHRDLKPGNILIDESGQPYITDLGLARRVEGDSHLTRTGAVIGTPGYMPPEQAAGSSDITTAADIYSLGAIIYEIMTGRPPFRGSTPVETLMQVINEVPDRPSLSGHADRGLEMICMKCLAKDPEQRYSSASALAEDLRRWLNGEPISVRAPSLANVTRFWLQQNFGRGAWALLIGPIAGMVSGMCLWYSTVSTDYDTAWNTLSQFPSLEQPRSLLAVDSPDWLKIPLMIVFAMSVVFIGFLTAVYVQPKNRGADLAAGTIVGLFATLTAFLVALGPISVLGTVNRQNFEYIHKVVHNPAAELDPVVAKAYPELGEFKKEVRVSKLTNLIHAELMFDVPRGIWLGLWICVALYFIPCVFETCVGGRMMRTHATVWRAFPAYHEVAFPVVTLMLLTGMAFALKLIMGGVGITFSDRTLALIAFGGLALVAVRRRWPVLARVTIQGLLLLSFVLFISFDFNGMPAVARTRGDVLKANRNLEREPNRFARHLEQLEAKFQAVNAIAPVSRTRTVIASFDDLIQTADEIAAQTELDGFDAELARRQQCMSRLSKVLYLLRQNRLEEADQLWVRTRDEFPGFVELAGVRIQILNAQNAREKQD